MANIIDPRAVAFSNNQVRIAADAMGQAYYRAVAVGNRWTSLGSNQAALDQMQAMLKDAADHIIACYTTLYMVEKCWFGLTGLSALFPNDTSPVFDLGGTAQDSSRPMITGAMVNNVITRAQQFQNWLLSATQSFTDAARGSVAALNTVLQASSKGPTPIVLADAGNLINRCTELVTNYQAISNANLTTILQVAVNPTL